MRGFALDLIFVEVFLKSYILEQLSLSLYCPERGFGVH
jgi:hypothetical protein